MSTYEATIHLSNDFRRTGMFMGDDSAEKAALDGCYDGAGFTLRVDARGPGGVWMALEQVYAIANSYPEELHCQARYADEVRRYREGENRSLSVGDLVVIRNVDTPSETDGRYVVASVGFERVRS